jgi:hypothetical protein
MKNSVTQTSAAEASTNRVNEKIVAARKTLEPEPSPLSVRKTAGGYEDFTMCRVEPIRAQGLKNGSEKKLDQPAAGSSRETGTEAQKPEANSRNRGRMRWARNKPVHAGQTRPRSGCVCRKGKIQRTRKKLGSALAPGKMH